MQQINEKYPEYISGQSTKNQAEHYSKIKNISTRYLAYRDLQSWLDLINGKEALDYGCGIGYSIDFLLNKGFKVTGVDINPGMVEQAKKEHPKVDIYLTKKQKLPFPDKSFDLVFSSLVLFELKNKTDIYKYIIEARRILRDNGYFIAITGSSYMHNYEYKSIYRTSNFPENCNATSGDLVRIHSNEADITFFDYLWFENDYRQIFKQAGLPICRVHNPLGKTNENYEWLDELTKSPLLLILAAKDCK